MLQWCGSDDSDLVASSVCKCRPCLILLSGPRPKQAGEEKKKKKRKDVGERERLQLISMSPKVEQL